MYSSAAILVYVLLLLLLLLLRSRLNWIGCRCCACCFGKSSVTLLSLSFSLSFALLRAAYEKETTPRCFDLSSFSRIKTGFGSDKLRVRFSLRRGEMRPISRIERHRPLREAAREHSTRSNRLKRRAEETFASEHGR